jgi:hypothetical protein
MMMVFACQSKSGKLADIQPEKVVILDQFIHVNEGPFKYRVKRLSLGVIDIIYDYKQFEAGDTILARFK